MNSVSHENTDRQELSGNSTGIKEFSAMLDGLPHGVLLVAPGNQIQYANSSAEEIFQTSSIHLVKSTLDAILPPDSPILSLVKRARKVRAPVNEYQLELATTRGGAGRVFDINAAPIRELADRIILVFNERSMADKINRQLVHRGAARSVTGLAAMLAHEIKNPLSGIRGAAQLLERAVEGDDMELAQLITAETDRVTKIVDRMEVFSDERPPVKSAVNMHDVLGHVKKIAEAGFAGNVEIKEVYDPSLPPVSGNRDQLVQVFLNLVKNAVEQFPPESPGLIKLSSAYRPGIRLAAPGQPGRAALPLEFCVSDNGTGIPDEIRAHVFEPFVTTKTNGSGLGLALVAKIIGNHGGMVECEAGNRGTTFRILLPAWTPDGEEADR